MRRFRVTENFYLDEFIPQREYEMFTDRARHLIRPQIIDIAQYIRDFTGVPIMINNWWNGGRLHYRGFRPCDIRVGALRSYHKMGMAIDISSPELSPAEILTVMMPNGNLFKKLGLKRAEDPAATKAWLHLDMGHVDPMLDKDDEIYVFKIAPGPEHTTSI